LDTLGHTTGCNFVFAYLARTLLREADSLLPSNVVNFAWKELTRELETLPKLILFMLPRLKPSKPAIQNLPEMEDNYPTRLKRMLKEYAQIN